MKIDSSFFGRLAKAVQTSRPEPNDSVLSVDPQIGLTMPLGTPLRLVNLGSTLQDGGIVSNVRAITNAAGQSDLLVTLAAGVWRVRINFSAIQDFAGFAAGSRVDMKIPTGGAAFALIQFTPPVSVPQWGFWEDTIYVGDTVDLVQVTPAAGVGQTTTSAAQVIAQRLI